MITSKVLFFLVICMLTSVLSSSNSDPNEVDASNNLLVHNLDTGLNYSTIQEAISALETLDGHTIFAEQGIYSGHITVHKALSIIGEDKETTIIDGRNLGYGIYITASNVNITGFTIQNCSPAQSGHGVIIDNTYYYVKKSVCNRINGNIIKNNVRGIFFHNSSMNTISENLIVNNTEGIYLEGYSGYNTISNNLLENNTKGILLDYGCPHNSISNNTLYSSSVVMRASAHYSRFDNNIIFNDGVSLMSSNYCTVYQNTMSNGGGIGIYGNHNIIYENILKNGHSGLYIHGSNVTLYNNTMIGNKFNFGMTSVNYNNSVDKSNTVDGKPIYYIKCENDLVINASTNAGTIYLINCTNVTIRDLALTRNYRAISLYNTNYSKIEDITITNFCMGIVLQHSHRNLIQDSNMTAENRQISDGIILDRSEYNIMRSNTLVNNGYGLGLGIWAHNNLIEDNSITANIVGVSLSFSSNNTITRNCIQDNSLYGIRIFEAANNTIYHNSFMNNTCRIERELEYPNTWDIGYPLGGNYWNDFEERYPNATELNDSGIWDTPYVIDENNQDNYPLIPELSTFIFPLIILATSITTWVYKKKKV